MAPPHGLSHPFSSVNRSSTLLFHIPLYLLLLDFPLQHFTPSKISLFVPNILEYKGRESRDVVCCWLYLQDPGCACHLNCVQKICAAWRNEWKNKLRPARTPPLSNISTVRTQSSLHPSPRTTCVKVDHKQQSSFQSQESILSLILTWLLGII